MNGTTLELVVLVVFPKIDQFLLPKQSLLPPDAAIEDVQVKKMF